ncbi:hypothetical protein POX_h09442 [Penicillium oxalicum]|uniref:hypothetical protein n=1 Tax=Penicillium oxalicum TaxID=69781 RepID=UPI0020B8164C|nr:hypothetical protein POX_h09442 [Penicillium oxalicum]KAI2785684.1 hypothetical protein POX_h09442 [Penicillium oxalicum]
MAGEKRTIGRERDTTYAPANTPLLRRIRGVLYFYLQRFFRSYYSWTSIVYDNQIT